MDILKLFIVFCVIILVMWLKKPISIAVLAATVVTILIYRLPIATACSAMIKGATSWTTIEALLVFYSITFLQRMLEKRQNLHNCQVALNGLFNNRRINASIAPFLLGCLPAASTVLICGPIVRDSVGDYLSTPEKAAVTSYFRHISESFLPTYTTIFIAVGLTNGAVSVSSFVLAMLPMVAALFVTGYLVYLRKIPKDTGMVPDHPKPYYWKLLAQSAWSIALAILIILIFKLPVELAVLICIIINVFVNRFNPKELVPFFKTAFEARLLVSTWLVMIFKEVLAATGVIELLPEFFCADFLFWNDRSRKPSYDCAVYANGHGNRKQRGGPVPVRPAHVHQLCCNAGLTGSHLPDALRRGLPGSAVIHGCEDHADGLRVYSHIVSILRLIEIRWALDGIIARCQKPNKETNSRRHAAACCSVKS